MFRFARPTQLTSTVTAILAGFASLTFALTHQPAHVHTAPDAIACEIRKPEGALDTDLLRERTVIGTVVDESVDRIMDERDRVCIRALLDHQDDGYQFVWQSAETGISFSIVAVHSFRSGGGLLCREFSAASQRGDLTIGVARRVACRQLSGDWLVRK